MPEWLRPDATCRRRADDGDATAGGAEPVRPWALRRDARTNERQPLLEFDTIGRARARRDPLGRLDDYGRLRRMIRFTDHPWAAMGRRCRSRAAMSRACRSNPRRWHAATTGSGCPG